MFYTWECTFQKALEKLDNSLHVKVEKRTASNKNIWKLNNSLFIFPHNKYGVSAIKGWTWLELFKQSQKVVSAITIFHYNSARYIGLFPWDFDCDSAGFTKMFLLLQDLHYAASPLEADLTVFDFNQWWRFARKWLAWNFNENNSYRANAYSPWDSLYKLSLLRQISICFCSSINV